MKPDRSLVNKTGHLDLLTTLPGDGVSWFDRSGKVTGTLGMPGVVYWGAISPDGKTVAVDRLDSQTRSYDVWLHDLERGTASRFTFGSRSNEFPVWSPDGSHIAFASFRDGVGHPFQKATSGTAQDEVLSKPGGGAAWQHACRRLVPGRPLHYFERDQSQNEE
jgi:Tol biopolymer transport system component